MGFEPHYPLSQVRPAPYNPRAIDDEGRCALRASIEDLGMLKPIIVCDDGRLIAGHQRTVGLHAIGCETVPAWVLPSISYEDEVRFNQLHNASDVEVSDAEATVPASGQTGWVTVPAADIQAELLTQNAGKKGEILQLLAKYGPWGAIVATQSGEVLVSGLYAVCCKILGYPCLVYYVPDSKRNAVLERFGRRYGRFSYDHLERTTWTQVHVQKHRLRTGNHDKSRTYELAVLPRITRDMRILDFGAGQMDYATRLRAEGYDIHALEFYLRKPHSFEIDVPAVNRDIDRLCADLATRGRYDLVVCDSVLNSVDSQAAEHDVLTCLAAFCKPGGTVIFSGRSRDFVERAELSARTKADNRPRRHVDFMDADGISALYAQGVWRYQKFHTLEQVHAVTRLHFGERYTVTTGDGKPARRKISAASWQVIATNDRMPDEGAVREAVTREFSLPLPDGERYNRAADVLAALGLE